MDIPYQVHSFYNLGNHAMCMRPNLHNLINNDKVLSQNAALFYAAYWDKYLLTPHPFDVNLIAFNRDSSINKLLI